MVVLQGSKLMCRQVVIGTSHCSPHAGYTSVSVDSLCLLAEKRQHPEERSCVFMANTDLSCRVSCRGA